MTFVLPERLKDWHCHMPSKPPRPHDAPIIVLLEAGHNVAHLLRTPAEESQRQIAPRIDSLGVDFNNNSCTRGLGVINGPGG